MMKMDNKGSMHFGAKLYHTVICLQEMEFFCPQETQQCIDNVIKWLSLL
jgi:hypothetical protein